MPDDERLLRELAEILAPAPSQPSPDRVADLRRIATEAEPPGIRSRALLAAAAALVLIVGAAGAVALMGGDEAVEYAGPVLAPDGEEVGELTVTEIGIGRVVELRTDALEILPAGEFYEVWFVAPGDRPDQPRRISAGTFHPDPGGRSDVDLTAAVDPSLFPVLEVTAEPADGDPDATGVVALRTDLAADG